MEGISIELGLTVNGLGHATYGLGFTVNGLGNAPYGLGFTVNGFGNAPYGLGFTVNGLGNAPYGLGFMVNGLGNASYGLGFTVNGFGIAPYGLGNAPRERIPASAGALTPKHNGINAKNCIRNSRLRRLLPRRPAAHVSVSLTPDSLRRKSPVANFRPNR